MWKKKLRPSIYEEEEACDNNVKHPLHKTNEGVLGIVGKLLRTQRAHQCWVSFEYVRIANVQLVLFDEKHNRI